MFDGIDQTTLVLITAREIMCERGYAHHVFEDKEGRVCAQGAINIARGRDARHTDVWEEEATIRLARHVSADYADQPRMKFRPELTAATLVSNFNNDQESIEPVFELFDKAIAS